MPHTYHYESFLTSESAAPWKRFGTVRRAGVVMALFSVYSKQSLGIGEIPDLKHAVDWCQLTAMSIIQLLPMNDVGFEFRPYDAQSSFALDPMYLSLLELKGVKAVLFKKQIEEMKVKFPAGRERVNYGIKAAKLELLWKMFKESARKKIAAFERYRENERYWLEDYAVFKVLKEIYGQSSWESWPEEFRRREEGRLNEFKKEHADSIRFHAWLQWQLFEQFSEVKTYAKKNGIFFLGDLPFLVSRDSADVWAHQSYFKLDWVSGAPPDAYYAGGQRWGMPAYNWEVISEHRYDYPAAKLLYAQNFYDSYRIDHFVGLFRLWTIHIHEPLQNEGKNGQFDPREEHLWEDHGVRILQAAAKATRMLPCAEDLGTIPECSARTLERFGIPGLDVQRWNKCWGSSFDFKKPEEYRKNSIAVISTHDSSSFSAWWEYEADTVDQVIFRRLCENHHLSFDEVKGHLFDLEHSQHGRLRWKKEIYDVTVLLAVIRRQDWEARGIIDCYLGTYGEKAKFWHLLGLHGHAPEKSTHHLVHEALRKVHETASVFSVQLLQEWLALSPDFKKDTWSFRINFPGTMGEYNWSIVMPWSLEEMKDLQVNHEIAQLNRQAKRI